MKFSSGAGGARHAPLWLVLRGGFVRLAGLIGLTCWLLGVPADRDCAPGMSGAPSAGDCSLRSTMTAQS